MRQNSLKSGIPFFLLLILFLLSSKLGYAQTTEITRFPSRPITFIIPVPPGGGTDLSIRVLVKEAEKFIGQPIVVVNKPGGALSIGVATIAAAKPDGYTIGFAGGGPLVLAPFLEKLPYDPLKDLQPIIQFGYFSFGVVVKADSPLKSFEDFVAYGRQNPKKLTYGTTGRNSLQYFLMELIAKKEGIQITHIPFKGTPESQVALLGGHILAAVGDFNYSLLESGQIRLLLLLSDVPSKEYPEVPILKDVGCNYPNPVIMNVYGPKNMPEEIVKKLEEAFTKAVKQPTFINTMKELHIPIVYRNSKELNDYIVYNYSFFEKLLKDRSPIK